jgi:hypothetical protein
VAVPDCRHVCIVACWEVVMRLAALLVAGRRAAVRTLLVGVAVAGLVAGWLAGPGPAAHSPGGHPLATDGTIIVED